LTSPEVRVHHRQPYLLVLYTAASCWLVGVWLWYFKSIVIELGVMCISNTLKNKSFLLEKKNIGKRHVVDGLVQCRTSTKLLNVELG